MGKDGFPQIVTLRDGAKAQVEPFKDKDATSLKTFYRQLPEEDRLVLKDDVTTEQWAKRFQSRVEQGEVICLIAKLDGALIGEASLYRAFHGWARHVGEIRLTVGPKFRRKGLGTALASAMVKIAMGLGIEKLHAQIVENQAGARRTLEKLGFTKEAILRGHVKDISGTKRDLQLWSNDVSQIWSTMESLLADYHPQAGD